MAGEATVTLALQFTKGQIPTQTLASGAISRDISGANYVRNVQSVGITIEPLLLGDVATPGLCLFHNPDPTNFVTVYPDGTNPGLIKIKPGDWLLLRFSSATPNVKADTAPVALEYLLLPD
jgi:hypothetical protein